MPSPHETRAKQIIDALDDKELEELGEEKPSIKELSELLEKSETMMGPPGSLKGPPVWELVKAPFTGRIRGVEVERGLWPWGLIVISAIGAIVAPIFGLLQWIGFWNLSRSGFDAKPTDSGLHISSKRKGHVASHDWRDIAQFRRIFDPPITYWELVLKNGDEVPLVLAELNAEQLRSRGIKVNETAKFRSEYKIEEETVGYGEDDG